MPIETNLNATPYFDDYDENKNYHRILFRPGVALQAREVTQLQTILQNQIERFGDNVYIKGTVIDGCAISPDYNYNYIKILDQQVDGQPVVLRSYNNQLAVQESYGLQASVVNYVTGLESQDPDLNTLYIKYINTGTGGEKTFAAGQVVKIFNADRTVESINIVAGGTGYSNSDVVVIYGTTGASATATITTNSDGKITDVSMINKGIDYTTVPNVFITSPSPVTISVVGEVGSVGALPTPYSGDVGDVYIVAGNSAYAWNGTSWNTTAGVGASLTATNFIAQITVAGVANSVGVGAAINTQQGIIYQKGNFIRVDPQTAILQKYSLNINDKFIGFKTTESIVNSNVDTSLLDLATGSPNFAAPGANRLKLTPVLSVVNSATASADKNFLPLIEFQDSNIVRDRSSTQFNSINRELSRRTFEESGNYVLDPFRLDTSTVGGNSTHFALILGPGTAYINGERVGLLNNTKAFVKRGVDYSTANNQTINTTYGSYVLVRQLLGNFDIKNGATVNLRDTAATDVTDNAGGTPTSPGSVIGTASVRSIELDSGTPGSPDAIYKLYIFNVRMSIGKVFQNVRSIQVNSTAVADVVLVNSKAVLNDLEHDTLVFNTGTYAVKQLTDTNFIFRTTTTGTLDTGGTSSITFSGTNTIPYGIGSLSNSIKNEFIIIPSSTFRFASNNAGTVTVANTATSNIDGTSTTFTTSYRANDFININSVIKQIRTVHSDTKLELYSPYGAAVGTANAHFTCFPANVPINFSRSGRTISVSSTTAMALNIGASTNVSTSFTMYHNLQQLDAAVKTKTVNANVHVKLSTTRISENLNGPWCLGIPDVYEIEGVYIGVSNSYSTSGTNFKDEFDLQYGQKDNFYGLSYLSKKPGSTITIDSTTCLAVKLKAFTWGGGRYISVSSYPVDDSTDPLPADKIRTETIPIIISPTSGEAISLRDAVDFRPIVANTAVLATTLGAASIDPSTTETIISGEKYYPSPSENFECALESYQGRIDRITLTPSGKIKIIEGVPSETPVAPAPDSGTMEIGQIIVAPFPSLTAKQSTIANRPDLKSIITLSQTRRYTMNDIDSLNKRLQRLEYYTALNLIEAETKNITIPSEANSSFERFKNGFFVDPFNDYSISNINDGEYKALIDSSNSRLVPQQEITAVDLKYSSGSTVTRIGDLVTLPYTSVVLASQPHANKERSLVTGFWSFQGKMTVIPRVDNFFDVDVNSTSVIDINIADPIQALTDSTNLALSRLNITPNAVRVSAGPTSASDSASTEGWVTTTRRNFSQTVTTTQDITTSRINTGSAVTTNTDVGTYLKSVSINPYIRSQRICLHVGGLRPGAQHYVFFDGVNVTSECVPASITNPSQATINDFTPLFNKGVSPGLFASATGTLAVILYLPGDTFTSGDKDILIMDVSSLISESSATSKSVGKFSSFSSSGTAEALTLSTKTFDVSRSPFVTNTFVNTQVLNVTQRNWSEVVSIVDNTPWADPLAQTFYVHPQEQSDYIHLTSVDIFFKEKDTKQGVTLELREVGDGGVVLPIVLPFSTIYKTPSEVSVSNAATVATTFTFKSPVFVKAGREYAIVLTPDGASPNYRVWTAVPGTADVSNTALTPNKTWGEGTMYYSTSNRAFSAVQDEDIKFTVRRARFTSDTGTVTLTNDDTEYLTIANTSGLFTGGEDVAQLGNTYLNTILTTNTSSTRIGTSSDISSTLTANSRLLVIYGAANSIGTGTVTVAGSPAVTVANGSSTNTAFTTKYSNGDFIRIGNEIRVIIGITSDTQLTIDSPLNIAAVNAAHYSVDEKFDILRVQSANATTITVDRPPQYNVSTSLAASVQRAVTGRVSYYNPTKGKLYIADSNAANSTFRIRTSNTTFPGYLIGDRSDAISRVTSIDNLTLSSFTPSISNIIVDGTSITQQLRVSKSGGGNSTFSYNITGKTDINVNDSIVVRSKSNEISGTSINKSLSTTLTLNSLFTSVSPTVDISPASLIFSKYLINNSAAGETTRYGNAQFKYISKRLVLADGLDAEDIKVYLSGYKPQGTNIYVYAKILGDTDQEIFEDKDWTELTQVTSSSLYSSTQNKNDVREYEYTFKKTPPSTELVGVSTANTGNAVVIGSGTSFSTNLTGGDIVKIVRTSTTDDYFISPILTVDSNTQITLETPVSFNSTPTGTAVSGLEIEKVTGLNQAFKYNQNSNIVRYYSKSQQAVDGYKYLAIKIALLSTNEHVVPEVDDVRVIAVSV